jgi:hypothetical protein
MHSPGDSASSGGTVDLTALTTRELLRTYLDVLDELQSRGLIRTRNSPLGDIAEYVAWLMYGGTIAPNSEKSFDIAAADGRRIQVKARSLHPTEKRSQAFSAVRSWDFEAMLCLVFDSTSFEPVWARELTTDQARSLGRVVAHTNSTAISVWAAKSVGVDVTTAALEAYARLP